MPVVQRSRRVGIVPAAVTAVTCPCSVAAAAAASTAPVAGKSPPGRHRRRRGTEPAAKRAEGAALPQRFSRPRSPCQHARREQQSPCPTRAQLKARHVGVEQRAPAWVDPVLAGGAGVVPRLHVARVPARGPGKVPDRVVDVGAEGLRHGSIGSEAVACSW